MKKKWITLIGTGLTIASLSFASPSQTTSNPPTPTPVLAAQKTDTALSKAKKAVRTLENEQTHEALGVAKDRLKDVKSSKERKKLKKRIDKVHELIEQKDLATQLIKNLEDAVQTLKGDETRSNLDAANAKLKIATDRIAELQKEIDSSKTNIEKKEQAQKAIQEAEAAVKALEADHSSAKLDDANKKVSAITDTSKKAELQKRVDAVKADVEKKKTEEATAAVANLEANQSRDNISDAQNKVNALTDESQKAALSTRITAVSNAISAHEAQEAAAQAAAQAAATAQQDQDTTTVYITATGSRYHFDPHCRGLNRSNSTTPTTLSDAIAKGFTRCKFE
ncbi:hypothetical protein [Streptococcus caballi]|uniref:hypothetical protein n=1 Tax=Streptococcus caballi TaxID=439220 RepID=UPI0003757607|nr:hypothetical protein [Streptococcus caballi]